jgi:hypothetical protein
MKHWILFCAIATASCGPSEGSPVVVVTIDSDLSVPDEIDQINILFIASREEDWGHTCRKSIRIHSMESARDLPVEIAFWMGDIYTTAVAFQVSGYLDNTEIPLVVRFGSSGWPSAGELYVPLFLESACVGHTEGLPEGEHCVGGLSQATGLPANLFDDSSRWVDETSCDE